ncbi:MAG: hypothetical protein KGL39_47265 [Patescibacteria group bacterium]|nr:hypothetical protein [Patescibacteria group bacterium]
MRKALRIIAAPFVVIAYYLLSLFPFPFAVLVIFAGFVAVWKWVFFGTKPDFEAGLSMVLLPFALANQFIQGEQP